MFVQSWEAENKVKSVKLHDDYDYSLNEFHKKYFHIAFQKSTFAENVSRFYCTFIFFPDCKKWLEKYSKNLFTTFISPLLSHIKITSSQS